MIKLIAFFSNSLRTQTLSRQPQPFSINIRHKHSYGQFLGLVLLQHYFRLHRPLLCESLHRHTPLLPLAVISATLCKQPVFGLSGPFVISRGQSMSSATSTIHFDKIIFSLRCYRQLYIPRSSARRSSCRRDGFERVHPFNERAQTHRRLGYPELFSSSSGVVEHRREAADIVGYRTRASVLINGVLRSML